MWQHACVSGVPPDILASVPVFSTLTDTQRERLIRSGEESRHGPGETLTDQGAYAHRFHLILEGRAVVERDGREVATVAAGDFVGEVALLGGGRSTATVRCTDATRCLTIRRESFWQTLQAEPAIALRILEVVCRRLEQEMVGRDFM